MSIKEVTTGFDWNAFVEEMEAVEELTLEQLESLVPEEEPSCVSIVPVEQSNKRELGSYNPAWLK